MFKKVLSIILIVLFIVPISAEVMQNSTYDIAYEHGKREGKEDTSALWIISGLFCVGPAIAYFYTGDVPRDMIVGQPPEYARGYTEGYTEGKRWRQVFYSSIGLLISATAGCISGFTQASTY